MCGWKVKLASLFEKVFEIAFEFIDKRKYNKKDKFNKNYIDI